MLWRRRPEPPAPSVLSPELRAAFAAEVDDGKGGKVILFDKRKCSHCGGLHDHACPRVKSMRFRTGPGGRQDLAEVQFWPAGEWSRDGIIWPWDVFAGVTPMAELSSGGQDTQPEEEAPQ